jgi:hypothetical protein
MFMFVSRLFDFFHGMFRSTINGSPLSSMFIQYLCIENVVLFFLLFCTFAKVFVNLFPLDN